MKLKEILNEDSQAVDAPYKDAQVIRGKRMIPPEEMTPSELTKYIKGLRETIKRAKNNDYVTRVTKQNYDHMLKRALKAKKAK